MTPQEWNRITEIAQNCKDFIESEKGVLVLESAFVRRVVIDEESVVFYGHYYNHVTVFKDELYHQSLARINKIKGTRTDLESLAGLFKEEW